MNCMTLVNSFLNKLPFVITKWQCSRHIIPYIWSHTSLLSQDRSRIPESCGLLSPESNISLFSQSGEVCLVHFLIKQDFSQFFFCVCPHLPPWHWGASDSWVFTVFCSLNHLALFLTSPAAGLDLAPSKPLSHLLPCHLMFIFQNFVDTPQLLLPSPILFLNVYIIFIPLLSLYWGVGESQDKYECSVYQRLPWWLSTSFCLNI